MLLSWCVCQYASLSGFYIILPYLPYPSIYKQHCLGLCLYCQQICSLVSCFHWFFVHYFLHLPLINVSSLGYINCSYVVLFLCGPLYMLLLLLLVAGYFSSCVKMLCSGSVPVLALFVVCFMWLFFLFLWCRYSIICYDDSVHLSLQLCHGSTVPHLPIELLQ